MLCKLRVQHHLLCFHVTESYSSTVLYLPRRPHFQYALETPTHSSTPASGPLHEQTPLPRAPIALQNIHIHIQKNRGASSGCATATMADRPQDTKTPSRSREASAVKTGYLILYNFVSAIFWTTVLGRTLLITYVHGYHRVYMGVGEFAKWTQTMALLEVVHAALGMFFFSLFFYFLSAVVVMLRGGGGGDADQDWKSYLAGCRWREWRGSGVQHSCPFPRGKRQIGLRCKREGSWGGKQRGKEETSVLVNGEQ